jgi:hypothetical protein
MFIAFFYFAILLPSCAECKEVLFLKNFGAAVPEQDALKLQLLDNEISHQK